MNSNINYVIWGCGNTHGYKQVISSSFNNDIIDNSLKETESFTDIAQITKVFERSNPGNNNNNFYSLERVSSSVLYTIYRTHWKRDNRPSYDAVTLIVDKDYVLQNPIDALKKILNLYISNLENGLKIFDFTSYISSLQLKRKNSDQKRFLPFTSSHAYKQNKDKKGYIKYENETELISSFKDEKNLFNFNKVFFFTSLPYLEKNGPGELLNLNNHKPFLIKINNFNQNYHQLKVDQKLTTYNVNSTEAYEGQIFQILKKKSGNVEKEIIVNKNTQSINLVKIKVNDLNSSYTKKKKMKNEDKLFISLILLMSLVFFIVFFYDEIKNMSKVRPAIVYEKIEKKAELINNTFFTLVESENKKVLKPDSLLFFFKDGGIVFNNDNVKETYSLKNNKISLIRGDFTNSDSDLDLKGILKLKNLIDNNDTYNNSEIGTRYLVYQEIFKIINLKKLKNKSVIITAKNMWKINTDFSVDKQTQEFDGYKPITSIYDHEGLEDLLFKRFTKNIVDSIKSKLADTKEDNSDKINTQFKNDFDNTKKTTINKKEKEKEKEKKKPVKCTANLDNIKDIFGNRNLVSHFKEINEEILSGRIEAGDPCRETINKYKPHLDLISLCLCNKCNKRQLIRAVTDLLEINCDK